MLSDTALLWTGICAAGALLLVPGVAYSLWTTRRRISSSRTWPTVEGEIIASEVEVPKAHNSDDDTDCGVALRYRYRVGGTDYEGTRLHAGRDAMTTKQAAEELAARYPRGARVPVHYRPDRPATAVLEPSDTANVTALIVFLVVFACIAAVLVAHAIAGKVVMYREGGVPLFAFLLPLACLAICGGGIITYARLRRRLRDSATWPATAGKIVSSAVAEVVETSRDSDDRARITTKYRADIRFAYTVAGREYHSTRWNGGWTALYGDSQGAQAIIARYPQGSSVPVYYDPKEPRTSVLEPQNKRGSLAPLVFAVVFGLGGALMLWAFTKM